MVKTKKPSDYSESLILINSLFKEYMVYKVFIRLHGYSYSGNKEGWIYVATLVLVILEIPLIPKSCYRSNLKLSNFMSSRPLSSKGYSS